MVPVRSLVPKLLHANIYFVQKLCISTKVVYTVYTRKVQNTAQIPLDIPFPDQKVPVGLYQISETKTKNNKIVPSACRRVKRSARETFGAPQFLRSALGGVTVTCERARKFFVAPFRTSKDKGFRQMYKSVEFLTVLVVKFKTLRFYTSRSDILVPHTTRRYTIIY